MSEVIDARTAPEDAVARAAEALQAGELVVVPTDTVYGVAADAFRPEATASVFRVKRRSRAFPLPVLIRGPKQLLGLVTAVPETAERLMAAYWPGPLTIVVATDPNLSWDLGDAQGTVAVRMPHDDVTLEIIRAVGPLAVTSANLSGQPAARNVQMAQQSLGDGVAVYVDGGDRADDVPSTIVDLTRSAPHVLREGVVPAAEALAVADGSLAPHEVGMPADDDLDGEPVDR
jgi:tRNA threonylcarbamoyl adenosine modification protein (Sua5/YciO/YrdC/YwlC family)